MKPLITIITITYNAESTIERTLRSVADQEFRDYEHLIIDGASRDLTVAMAREHAGVRILSEPDRGLYDAMNKGLRLARGKYLLFLNSGDTFRSNRILGAYADAAGKDADIIYGDTMIVDMAGHDVGPRHYSVPALLTRESFSRGMLVCHQAFMVKREIAPEFDLRYRFSADYDWTIRCIEATRPDRCVNLNRVCISYLSDGLTDRNKRKSLLERFRVMREHYGLGHTLKRHAELVIRAVGAHTQPHTKQH